MLQLSKTQSAINNHKTIFNKTVKSVSDGMGKTERALKISTNKKLKKKISIGKYKGFPMVSLTLEERATCTNKCLFWAKCYGNNMPFATRYKVDSGLLIQIEKDLDYYSTKYPNGFLVRLHVLGDFSSVDYVLFWERMLVEHPALHIFGYTDRWHNNALCAGIRGQITRLRLKYGWRFAIRDSNNPNHNFTALSMNSEIAKTKLKNKELFICPEQLGKVNGCGDCGLCWTSKKAVGFITH
jgi:hypothetical protein